MDGRNLTRQQILAMNGAQRIVQARRTENAALMQQAPMVMLPADEALALADLVCETLGCPTEDLEEMTLLAEVVDE